MITEGLIRLLLWQPMLLLQIIPTLPALELPSNVYDGLSDLLSCIGYVLPVKALLPILAISFAMGFAKIIIAIVIRVKSFIPTMGA